jgi:hypothetical protein
MSWLKQFVNGIAEEQAQRARAWWRRGLVSSAMIISLALIGLGGVAFVAMAGYFALRLVLVPWAAGLIMGAVMLALSGLGIWMVWRRSAGHGPAEARSAQPAAPAQAQVSSVTRMGEAIGAKLHQRDIRTTDVMIAAMVAGTVLGATPALRERLWQRKHRSNGNGRPYTRQQYNSRH